MFKVEIKKEIIEHCQNMLRATNFGKRGIADGNQSEQLRGIVGQCVIMDMLGIGLIKQSSQPDNGVDFTYRDKTYDVKTMGRSCDPSKEYVNNLIGHQKDYKVDRYIFTSLNKKNMTITICGWINKDEFYKKASFYPKGTERNRDDFTRFPTKADLYEIPNNMLNDVIDLEDLVFELKLN